MNQKMMDRLASLRKGIDSSKTELNKLEGRRAEATKQLKETHGISTIEEIDEELKSLESKSKKFQEEIEVLYKELQESYEW